MYTKGLTKITARFMVICMLIGMWMPAVIPTAVDATDMSADERITADIQALAWDVISGENTTADTITVNLVLPKTGENGSTISWSVSPDDGTINTNTGEVARPAADSEDKTVTLTATVSYAEGTSQTKDFILTIMKLVEDTYCTVTYDANGGSGTAPLETDKAEGVTFTAGVNSFTPPEGKHFKHWNTKADDTGTPYAEGENVTMPAENLTLYAIWADEKLVTFGAPWSGVGSGTVDDPYQVATAVQLNEVRYFLNTNDVYFKQTADIDLSDYDNWIPIGDDTNQFTGKYNGNGKTISNLTINDGTLEYVGLFGFLGEGGRLEEITLTNVSVTSTKDADWQDSRYTGGANVGGLVGLVYKGIVTGCSSTGSVKAGTHSFVGGLVGHNAKYMSESSESVGGTITNSTSAGSVTGGNDASVGGLVGYNYGISSNGHGIIDNCQSSATVTGGHSVHDSNVSIGGLVGDNHGKIASSHSTGDISGGDSTYVGGLVGYHYWNSVSEIKESSSTGNVSGGVGARVGALLGYDNGGSITLNSISITTPATKLAYAVGEALDINGLVVTGTYAGNNKAALPITSANITGFDSSKPVDNQVLTITFDGKTTTYAVDISLDWPGDGSGTKADPYQVATADQLDAVRNYLNTSDIYFEQTDDIDLSGFTNWIPIGEAWGKPFNGTYDGKGFSISNLTIANNNLIGVGLFGYLGNEGTLKNIHLKNIDVDSAPTDYSTPNVGGLVGYSEGIISNSSSTGSISGQSKLSTRIGGLVGFSEGTITDSFSSSSVNIGNADEGAEAGGLVGYNYRGNISRSYSSGPVGTIGSGTSISAGGLVGANDEGTISDSFSSSIVNIANANDAEAGGLVGDNYEGKISRSYSSGTISVNASGEYVHAGGLVGSSVGTVNSSYSTGNINISGNYNSVGRLIGDNKWKNPSVKKDGIVEKSYSVSNVTVKSGDYSRVGGLIGLHETSIPANNYYLEPEASTPDGGTPKSAAELKHQSTFVDWDFDTIWRIADGYTYPVLQWQPLTTDEEIVADLQSLTWGGIKGKNNAENNVAANLINPLPTMGANGTVMTWSANPTGWVNTDTGAITRPSHSQGDQLVTLTATITKDGGTAQTKSFTLTIKAADMPVDDIITLDKEALTWDSIKGTNGAEDNVMTNLINPLPTAGANGTNISWDASPTGWVNTDTGAITRPSHSQGDQLVTLTATITKDGGTAQTKSFTLTIKAQPATGGSGGGSSSSSEQNNTDTDGTATRTVQNGQKVDQVTINETKATELINDALNKNQNTITIEMNSSKEDPADKVEATLSKETLSRISNNDLSVTINSNHATISIPTTTLSNLSQDVTFTIEQIKASTEIQETDSVISIIAPNGTKVGQSLKIETNYEGKTDVTLPLDGINIPKDPDEQKTFLASLGVLVQHGKDDNEVVTGKIVYDQNNQPIGLSFSIERFSTFTILALSSKEQIENPTATSIIVNDINGHWAEETIRQLILKGAVGGYPDGTFKPNQTVTRAEFVAMLSKAIGIKETKNNSKTFSDIQNHWAKNVIEQAATNGIVNGLTEDQFGPNEEITREQMAVMIVNAGALKQVDSKNNFLDSEKIASWAESAVNTAANYKIVNGLPNQTFNPKGKATRAEAATVIMKLLNLNNE